MSNGKMGEGDNPGGVVKTEELDSGDIISSDSSTGGGDRSRASRLMGFVVEGRYRILSRIGVGGMGSVYRCEHIKLKKEMALKILRSKKPLHLERFRREAEAACRIRHPHIIDVTDFGNLPDGRLYFVMEYLEGRSLTALLDEAPLDIDRIVNLMAQICGALGVAHEMGFVHRDIKPDNIMIIDREGEFAKILDFGIAKTLDIESDTLTNPGQLVGTPRYLSPEQARPGPVDHRTDIFSLGLVLYEMATGLKAIQGRGTVEILMQLSQGRIEPPAMVAPQALAAAALNDVIIKATHMEVERRHSTMRELLDDIRLAARTFRGGSVETPSGAATVEHGPVFPISPAKDDSQTVLSPYPTADETLRPLLLNNSLAELDPSKLDAPSGLELDLSSSPRPVEEPFGAGLAGDGPLELQQGPSGLELERRPSPGGGRRKALVVALPLALVVLAVVIFFLWPREAPRERPSFVAPAAQGVDRRGDEVILSFHSQPPGAEVVQGETLLGTTPLTLPFPPRPEEEIFIIRMEGYRDHRAKVRMDRNSKVKARLRKGR